MNSHQSLRKASTLATSSSGAIAHSQSIITELLQCIVRQAKAPLQVSKFEGDAVFMYAVKADCDTQQDLKRAMRESIEAMFCGHARLVADLSSRMICRCRACESLSNLKPADVYFGRGQTILLKKGKDQTMDYRAPALAAPQIRRVI